MFVNINFEEKDPNTSIFTINMKVWHYVGLAIICLGLFLLLTQARSDYFECSRTDNTCTLKKLSILGPAEKKLPLSEITAVQIETVPHVVNLFRNSAYQVTLTTKTKGNVGVGGLLINDYMEAGKKKTAIENFLKNTAQPSVSFSSESYRQACCMSIFFPLMGLVLLLISNVTLLFNSKNGTLLFKKKSFISGSQKVYKLTDIKKFDKDMKMSRSESSFSRTRYRILIEFQDGKTKPLTAYHILTRKLAENAVDDLNKCLRHHKRELKE